MRIAIPDLSNPTPPLRALLVAARAAVTMAESAALYRQAYQTTFKGAAR